MVKTFKKPIIGILGGICSGKSTAAKEFAKLGCAVIDADEIAHQLLGGEKTKAKIVGLFGEEILDNKGEVGRQKLAKTVFSDRAKLEKLTGILHPAVLKRVESLLTEHNSNSKVKAIVIDMPLLMEVGWDKKCDYVLFIDCKPALRLERAGKTGIFDADELKIRENLQISLDKKKLIADNIVDNNSDLSGLSKQIAFFFTGLMDKW